MEKTKTVKQAKAEVRRQREEEDVWARTQQAGREALQRDAARQGQVAAVRDRAATRQRQSAD